MSLSNPRLPIMRSKSQQFDNGVGQFMELLKAWSYEESPICENAMVWKLDRKDLTYHPAFNNLWQINQKHHSTIENSEEHRNVFPQSSSVALRCKHLKDMLVRSKLHSRGRVNADSHGFVASM